jgi:5-carboxymethyl-2-hydroxymuconate isomerase
MKKIKVGNSKKEFFPGKLVCVGRNYSAHAKELGNEVPEFPIIFIKPSSDIIFSGDKIVHPEYSNELHHEVELVLLIGKTIKKVNENEAEEAIAGYGVGLDMTLRDLQNQLKNNGHPWTLAKCFDTSAVLSDFILKENYKLTQKENISLIVNNSIKQDSNLKNMIFKPAEIVKYISDRMTLEEGDLIFTGTPAGVGRVIKGDIIEAEIENIGKILTEVI